VGMPRMRGENNVEDAEMNRRARKTQGNTQGNDRVGSTLGGLDPSPCRSHQNVRVGAARTATGATPLDPQAVLVPLGVSDVPVMLDLGLERVWGQALDEEGTDVGASALGHRTTCSLCRRPLAPSLGGADGVGAPWAPQADATSARSVSAVNARRRTPGGYAIGRTRGRWTGWMCAPCEERLRIEEHQVAAQRALQRRVAQLERVERGLRVGRGGRRVVDLIPGDARTGVQTPAGLGGGRDEGRAGGRDRGEERGSPGAGRRAAVIALDTYRSKRALRRDLRVCRASLAELTATLVSVADDPVLAWPPCHPLHTLRSGLRLDRRPARATPVGPTDRSVCKHWGGATRRFADPCEVTSRRSSRSSRSSQEVLSAGVQRCATPVE